jgi:hypothetical protein
LPEQRLKGGTVLRMDELTVACPADFNRIPKSLRRNISAFLQKNQYIPDKKSLKEKRNRVKWCDSKIQKQLTGLYEVRTTVEKPVKNHPDFLTG